MENQKILDFVVTAIFLLAFTKLSFCLDWESAKERPLCSNTSLDTVPTDLNWFSSVKTWYYPLMSRYDLYNNARDLVKRDPKFLREDELYYDSCITWEIKEKKLVIRGFNDKKAEYDYETLDSGFESYTFFGEGGNGGTCYTTLTDNKTFSFVAGCLTDDQMVWGVVSPFKTLPKETVKLIHDHAESLGFNREYFTGLRYDSCCKQKKM